MAQKRSAVEKVGLVGFTAGLLRDPEGKVATSAVALAAANAVPLFGVLFLGWDAFVVVGLYWLENVVVGAVTVLRIALAGGGGAAIGCAKAFMIPFFCVHYGMFTFVHGVFVFALLGGGLGSGGGDIGQGGPLGMLTGGVGTLLARGGAGVGLGIAALVGSHAVSFVTNYLGRGEYKTTNAAQEMMRPYGRVVVMHITIIAGAFLAMAVGMRVAPLIVLVVLKTMMDLRAHAKEHSEGAKGCALG